MHVGVQGTISDRLQVMVYTRVHVVELKRLTLVFGLHGQVHHAACRERYWEWDYTLTLGAKSRIIVIY